MQNSKSAVKYAQSMCGNMVNLSSVGDALLSGRDTVMAIRNDVPLKMVVFFDSTLCSSCILNELGVFDPFFKISILSNMSFVPINIFTSKA